MPQKLTWHLDPLLYIGFADLDLNSVLILIFPIYPLRKQRGSRSEPALIVSHSRISRLSTSPLFWWVGSAHCAAAHREWLVPGSTFRYLRTCAAPNAPHAPSRFIITRMECDSMRELSVPVPYPFLNWEHYTLPPFYWGKSFYPL